MVYEYFNAVNYFSQFASLRCVCVCLCETLMKAKAERAYSPSEFALLIY